jgi:hypothetical protein
MALGCSNLKYLVVKNVNFEIIVIVQGFCMFYLFGLWMLDLWGRAK